MRQDRDTYVTWCRRLRIIANYTYINSIINVKRKPSSDFLFDLKAEEVHSVLNDMQIKKLEHRLSDIEIGHGIIRALSQKRHVTHPKIIKLQFPVRSMTMSLAVDPRYLVEAKKSLAQMLAARLGSHEIALEFLHAL